MCWPLWTQRWQAKRPVERVLRWSRGLEPGLWHGRARMTLTDWLNCEGEKENQAGLLPGMHNHLNSFRFPSLGHGHLLLKPDHWPAQPCLMAFALLLKMLNNVSVLFLKIFCGKVGVLFKKCHFTSCRWVETAQILSEMLSYENLARCEKLEMQ